MGKRILSFSCRHAAVVNLKNAIQMHWSPASKYFSEPQVKRATDDGLCF